MRPRLAPLLLASALAGACAADGEPPDPVPPPRPGEPGAPGTAAFAGIGVRFVGDDPREKRLRNLRQLTFEGENAEAYWSPDGSRLVFQHRGEGVPADQIYTIRTDGTDLRLASTGTGKTTCSFFLPGSREVLFASTHAASAEPPAAPDMSQGYVWAVYPDFDIWAASLDGTGLRRLTDSPGYDAEAVLSPDGSRIVFTSLRDGDLDLYTMAPDGSDVQRVTDQPGYDGGAFFSPDGKRLVFRASRPESPEALADYRRLLASGLVRPTALEIYTADVDGSGMRRVTGNGRANFAPYFHPDGKRILFSSNLGDVRGRDFDLWMIRKDGTDLEQVTFTAEFDGFPMFSPDGKTLAFCSNRHGSRAGETNVFIADWVE